MLRPQEGWYNQLDFPAQWTANNIDKATPHSDYRALTANHKAALDASLAETTQHLDGARHMLVFQPHLGVFHTGKALVPGVKIKMRLYFRPRFEGREISRPLIPRGHQTSLSSLSTPPR